MSLNIRVLSRGWGVGIFVPWDIFGTGKRQFWLSQRGCGVCYYRLVTGGQGSHSTSYNTQVSRITKDYPATSISRVEVKKPWPKTVAGKVTLVNL